MDDNHVRTVLVASEDESVLDLVKINLQNSKVIAVASARRFFETLLNESIDLIIFDPTIRALEGLEAFSVAKSYHSDIPSILVYEQENYDVVRSALEKGVLYRMLKPVSEKELAELKDGLKQLSVC